MQGLHCFAECVWCAAVFHSFSLNGLDLVTRHLQVTKSDINGNQPNYLDGHFFLARQ